jgi:hypothetical protein
MSCHIEPCIHGTPHFFGPEYRFLARIKLQAEAIIVLAMVTIMMDLIYNLGLPHNATPDLHLHPHTHTSSDRQLIIPEIKIVLIY